MERIPCRHTVHFTRVVGPTPTSHPLFRARRDLLHRRQRSRA